MENFKYEILNTFDNIVEAFGVKGTPKQKADKLYEVGFEKSLDLFADEREVFGHYAETTPNKNSNFCDDVTYRDGGSSYTMPVSFLPEMSLRLKKRKPKKTIDKRSQSMQKMFLEIVVEMRQKSTLEGKKQLLEYFQKGKVRPLIKKAITYDLSYSKVATWFGNSILAESQR